MIIHVGFPKTATTFLQAEIFPKIINRRFLPLDGTDKKAVRALLQLVDVDKFTYLDDVYNNLKKYDIISFESLSGRMFYPYTDDKYVIGLDLKKMFPDAKIIIGTRERYDLIESAWKQYIKEGGTLTFGKFRTKIFRPGKLNYEIYIRFMENLFPDVFVYKFEELKSYPHKVIKELLDFMGCDIYDYQIRHYNVAWNSKQLKLARFLNYLFRTPIDKRGIIPWPKILWHLRASAYPPRVIVQNIPKAPTPI